MRHGQKLNVCVHFRQVIMEAFRAVLADYEAAKKRQDEEETAKMLAQEELEQGEFDDPF